MKIFRGNPQYLEAEINQWIDEVSPTIKNAVQSHDAGSFTLTIFYEKSSIDLPLPLLRLTEDGLQYNA